MTSMLSFDYDEFLRQYRLSCARRGIDPNDGATAYQVVHLTAERRRKTWRCDPWWQSHELWFNCPPDRSETEEEALWNVLTQAYAVTVRRAARAVRRRRICLALRDLSQREIRNK